MPGEAVFPRVEVERISPFKVSGKEQASIKSTEKKVRRQRRIELT